MIKIVHQDATVVTHLDQKTAFLLFLSHLLGETKWVVKVEDPVNFIAEVLETRVVSRLSSLHVMLVVRVSSTAFIPKLEEANNGNDLPTGRTWKGVPLLFGAQVGGRKGIARECVGPGPHKVRLDPVSDER